MELNKEHLAIMRHTDLNQTYCGDEQELQELCEGGMMRCLGKKSFVPEPYFTLTAEGKDALYQSELKANIS